LSYILDALKKSEQERSRGTVPDIKTIHEPGTALPARSSSRIYVILMVLLFVVAGLGYWIVYEKSRHSATRSRLLDSDEIVTSPSSDSDAAAALTDNQPMQSLESTQHQTDNQIQLSQNLTALSELAEKDNQAASLPGKSDSTKNISPSAKSEKKDHAKSGSSRPNVIFADEPLTSTPGASTSARSADSNANSSTDHSNSPATEDDVIYDIAELPEDVKRNLPAITFAGHVYSSSKSQRSVMLNGKKMREGEEVAKGMVLDQITVEGVVFRSQGYRFKLGALQDWSFQ